MKPKQKSTTLLSFVGKDEVLVCRPEDETKFKRDWFGKSKGRSLKDYERRHAIHQSGIAITLHPGSITSY